MGGWSGGNPGGCGSSGGGSRWAPGRILGRWTSRIALSRHWQSLPLKQTRPPDASDARSSRTARLGEIRRDQA